MATALSMASGPADINQALGIASISPAHWESVPLKADGRRLKAEG
jgi:hypothetical protein